MRFSACSIARSSIHLLRMKLQAIILALTIVTYVTENTRIPLVIKSNDKEMCCKAKMKMHKKTNSKPAKCNNNSCINCPLINTFTFHPFLSADIITVQFSNKFYPLETKTVTGVYWKVWRPPDVS